MVAFLKREIPANRLRIKQADFPLATSEVLGSGIDVMTLPEGHMSCVKCGKYKFECWVMLDQHRLEIGCLECGSPYRLLFPMDCPLPFNSGKFECMRHPSNHFKTYGWIIIHNSGTLCVGCEKCYTEVRITLRTESNIILPGSIQ